MRIPLFFCAAPVTEVEGVVDRGPVQLPCRLEAMLPKHDPNAASATDGKHDQAASAPDGSEILHQSSNYVRDTISETEQYLAKNRKFKSAYQDKGSIGHQNVLPKMKEKPNLVLWYREDHNNNKPIYR